jgi:tetratricopeptide (TPR) repeat protein
VVRAQVVDVVNDRILWSLDPIASPPNDPLKHADALRDRIAGAVAAAFDTQVRSLTLPSSRTPTFPAYQEYVLGLEAFQLEHATSALAHFRRSAELDTTFSLPFIWAVYATWRAGLPDDSSIAVLARHRPPPGTLEELQLQEFQSKDQDESFLLLERGAKRSPGSVWSFRAGEWLSNKRRVREALRYWDDLDPQGWVRMWFNYWKPYVESLHEVGRYEDELRASRTFLSLFPPGSTELAKYDAGPFMRAHEGMALIALGRTKEAREQLSSQMTQWDHLVCMSSSDFWQASMLEFLAHGQPTEAAAFGRRWIETCERSVAIDTASGAGSYAERDGSMLWLGVAYYRSGRYADAERALTWAMSRPDADSGSRAYAAGFLGRIAAKRGDRLAAEKALAAIPNKAWGELPVYHTGNLSELYAVIEGFLGEPEKAVERLKTAQDEIFYLHFHRDPDFAPLWKYPPFIKFAAPR